MKKLLTIMLSMLLLTACGGATSSTTEEASSTPEDTSSSVTATIEKFKVGIVLPMEHPSLIEISDAVIAELSVLGYDEDKVEIIYQNAQADSTLLNSICQGFVAQEVDLIVAVATGAAQAAAAATSEIPIVFSAVTDPIIAGLTETLEAPDANLTGTSDKISVEDIFNLSTKLTPEIKKFGIMYDLSEVNSEAAVADFKALLDTNGIEYVVATISSTGEVATASQTLVTQVDAIFSPTDNTVASAMSNLAEIAIDAKIPVYVGADSMVNDGALATVGVNYTQLGKQTASMVVRVLEGAKISEVPVEVLDGYSVVINEETATAIGISAELVASVK